MLRAFVANARRLSARTGTPTLGLALRQGRSASSNAAFDHLVRWVKDGTLPTGVNTGVNGGPAFCRLYGIAGIRMGARTGRAPVVTALCFVPCVFLGPLAAAVPGYATAAVLILVGVSMFQSIATIDFLSSEDALPAFVTVVLIPLTLSITQRSPARLKPSRSGKGLPQPRRHRRQRQHTPDDAEERKAGVLEPPARDDTRDRPASPDERVVQPLHPRPIARRDAVGQERAASHESEIPADAQEQHRQDHQRVRTRGRGHAYQARHDEDDHPGHHQRHAPEAIGEPSRRYNHHWPGSSTPASAWRPTDAASSTRNWRAPPLR
jgi:hypothetical protein